MSAKTEPATIAAAITPANDGEHLFRALWIGGAGGGSLKVDMADSGAAIIFLGVEAGLLPIAVRRVYATDTDVTNIIGLN